MVEITGGLPRRHGCRNHGRWLPWIATRLSRLRQMRMNWDAPDRHSRERQRSWRLRCCVVCPGSGSSRCRCSCRRCRLRRRTCCRLPPGRRQHCCRTCLVRQLRCHQQKFGRLLQSRSRCLNAGCRRCCRSLRLPSCRSCRRRWRFDVWRRRLRCMGCRPELEPSAVGGVEWMFRGRRCRWRDCSRRKHAQSRMGHRRRPRNHSSRHAMRRFRSRRRRDRYGSATVPVAAPGAVAPAVMHRDADGDTDTECEDGGGDDSGGTVAGRHVGSAVDDGGVVLRDVDHLRIGGLNDDGLRSLLHDGDL